MCHSRGQEKRVIITRCKIGLDKHNTLSLNIGRALVALGGKLKSAAGAPISIKKDWTGINVLEHNS